MSPETEAAFEAARRAKRAADPEGPRGPSDSERGRLQAADWLDAVARDLQPELASLCRNKAAELRSLKPTP